ncbi:hypothetical protein [Legionella yabuuchiae]|uniref:hypothetical protein n=1 Tax=Legionella yabuuchiae TaxID=376727 RepID=UPI0010555131|nr:hypothetical protein [Legionella yabuuchiae]
MKKLVLLVLAMGLITTTHASKLSDFFNKMEARDKARKEQEIKQDMNFSDFAYKYERRFTNAEGESCREYIFRSRSNPYLHGRHTICNGR